MDLINLTLNIQDKSALDVQSCIAAANDGAGVGDERWRSLWREPMISEHIQSVQELSDSLISSCLNVLVIGIGGSALGAKALHGALAEETPNFFVLDNVDPHTVQQTIQSIKNIDPSLANTVVVVISKSGETAEVAALCMVAEQQLPAATFVAITGKTGSLRDHATKQSWSILLVPDGVGGRFSVLSPVGLFPAALCGIDILKLLDGAQSMDDQCAKLENNPAANLAHGLVSSMKANRNIHVMMTYCDRLSHLAQWYVQLWAESLGKMDGNSKRVGPTPIAAIGATDQHSMLQLWREGPADKVIGFVRVLETQDVQLGSKTHGEEQAWLRGQTMGSLLLAEQQATEKSMHDVGQSTWTLTLPRIDAYTIGQFIALWQATVAIAGRLLDINPYDQQGVEHSKQLTREAFGLSK